MIRIVRPENGPANLKRLGESQTRLDCAAYDACPDDYRSGMTRFYIQKYYSARPVKDLLIKIHHSKCCYCEKRFSRSNLHVEHFRPKSGVRQTLTQKKDELPGYYWLAYCWDNLLLSCHDCNNLYKGTRFPLANPKERARSHNDDPGKESPRFVDPVEQDPSDHIRFDGHTPKGRTRQGQMTIKGIGLRRAALREDRLELLNHIKRCYTFLEVAAKYPGIAELQVVAKEMLEFIEAAMRPEAEFSLMVIDYVKRRGLPRVAVQPSKRATKAPPAAVRSPHSRKS